MANLISASSAPIAGFGNKEYHDLLGTVEVLKKILRHSVVDGFELQLEPEWDSENPPLTDADWADWSKTPKYTADDVVRLVEQAELPILSVHASRDVGSYLCSDRKRDFEKGKRVAYDSLLATERLDAKVCVFHLWDTWSTSFEIDHLAKTFQDIADQFPRVKASVENIPTHLKGHTPFGLVRLFEYVTLDLRWAALYKELDKFEQIARNVVNVHLRGSLQADKWVIEGSDFGFYEAVDLIKSDWKYSGLLTVEPEGRIDGSLFESFLEAMRSLKEHDQ